MIGVDQVLTALLYPVFDEIFLDGGIPFFPEQALNIRLAHAAGGGHVVHADRAVVTGLYKPYRRIYIVGVLLLRAYVPLRLSPLDGREAEDLA